MNGREEGSVATFITVVLRSRNDVPLRLGLELLLPGALPAAAPLWLLSRCGIGIRGMTVRGLYFGNVQRSLN